MNANMSVSEAVEVFARFLRPVADKFTEDDVRDLARAVDAFQDLDRTIGALAARIEALENA